MLRTSLLRGRRHYRRLRHRPAILQSLPPPLTLNGSNHQNSPLHLHSLLLPPAPGIFREWLLRCNNVMVGDGTTWGALDRSQYRTYDGVLGLGHSKWIARSVVIQRQLISPGASQSLFTNSWLVERVGGVGNRRAGSSGSSSDGATV